MPQRNMPLFFNMLVISQVGYGFRMLTLSNTHSVGIKGYTRNTPANVMWYELWLRAIKERHKVAHFKDYQRVWGDPQYPPPPSLYFGVRLRQDSCEEQIG